MQGFFDIILKLKPKCRYISRLRINFRRVFRCFLHQISLFLQKIEENTLSGHGAPSPRPTFLSAFNFLSLLLPDCVLFFHCLVIPNSKLCMAEVWSGPMSWGWQGNADLIQLCFGRSVRFIRKRRRIHSIIGNFIDPSLSMHGCTKRTNCKTANGILPKRAGSSKSNGFSLCG